MKTFPIILALVTMILSRASAQVTVEVTLSQDEFLPGESIPLAVKITNRSGQQIHLGAEANWLTFSVESPEGRMVVKNSEVPVDGEFDLESSQMGTKHVDIAPSFQLTRPGRYTVTATLHMKAWNLDVGSTAKPFDVVSGAKLWSQDFGVPSASGAPEMRRYTLEQASYLRSQMRLYMELSDPDEVRIFKTASLGQTVSFARPESQVDRTSRLHVLWQSGAQSFDYCLIDHEGAIVDREIYDDFNTRPRLVVSDSGDVSVQGGVRRPKPGDLPIVATPAQVQQVTPPATATK